METVLPKLALITGITGQDGSYLSELLLEKGYKVYGIIRRASKFNTTRIDHIRDRLNMRYGDMTDGASMQSYLHSIVNSHIDASNGTVNFEVLEIYNLAAQSHVKISFQNAEYTSMVDAIGTLRLLEAIMTIPEHVRGRIKIYQAGTSEMFGRVLETPQNESTPFNPMSPYACAKVYAHNVMKVYREGYGLFAVNGVLFNHESPRRGENFVTKKVIDGIKEIIAGKRQCIELGNLDSKRDWGHAKEYVEGMWRMMQYETPQDFVLATGHTYTIRHFVGLAFKMAGVPITWSGEGVNEVATDADGVVRVKINPKYYRPCEVDLLLGDATKARQLLNWQSSYTIGDIIGDMLAN